jgi:hypothetical protein
MTPELYAMMLDWLASGTDAQKFHASHRLSLPDAVGYEVPPGYRPPPPPIPRDIPDRPPPGTGVRLGGCCGG